MLELGGRQKQHLQDLSAGQLATTLCGVWPGLTPISLNRVGGDVLQVALSMFSETSRVRAGLPCREFVI